MLNYNKNKLINECLDTYYETFSHTLDTADYVPKGYNKKILRYIFKNMRKAFRRVDKEDKRYQRELKEKARIEVPKAENNSVEAIDQEENNPASAD